MKQETSPPELPLPLLFTLNLALGRVEQKLPRRCATPQGPCMLHSKGTLGVRL